MRGKNRMVLTETEAEIISSVASLGEATKQQIRKGVGFSLEYLDIICTYLVRKGYLNFFNRHYSLTEKGIRVLLREGMSKDDRTLIKDIAMQVAAVIRGEVEKTIKEIYIPVTQIEQRVTPKPIPQIRQRVIPKPTRKIEIKTDFEYPIEDESLALESNIDRLGVNQEEVKSSIEDKVELLNKFIRSDKNRKIRNQS